jgi:hypothetical protein
MTLRVYCKGKLTKALLAAQLDDGMVCTDNVSGGGPGGCDVAYFRPGTPEEIAFCRAKMQERAPSEAPETKP